MLNYWFETMDSKNRTKGFSLIELLLVMTLAGIVASLAIPSYRLMISKIRMTVACEQLKRAIAMTREAAINHQVTVILCGSRSGSSCDGHWYEGQLVSFKSPLKSIAYLPALPPDISVQWRANLGHNQALEFGPRGLPAGQWGSFWLKSLQGGVEGRITVNASGHVS